MQRMAWIYLDYLCKMLLPMSSGSAAMLDFVTTEAKARLRKESTTGQEYVCMEIYQAVLHTNFNEGIIGEKNLTTEDVHIKPGYYILGITETKLTSRTTDEQLDIEGYKFIRKDREKQDGGGGCMLCYLEDLDLYETDIIRTKLEAIWVDVELHSHRISVCDV